MMTVRIRQKKRRAQNEARHQGLIAAGSCETRGREIEELVRNLNAFVKVIDLYKAWDEKGHHSPGDPTISGVVEFCRSNKGIQDNGLGTSVIVWEHTPEECSMEIERVGIVAFFR